MINLVTFMILGASAQSVDPVLLNSASTSQLADATGISSELADAVIALRDERGRLGSVEELRIIPGISADELSSLRRETSINLNITRGDSSSYSTVDEVMSVFDNEPTVRQVQAIAEDYTYTNRSQVESWLNASEQAAMLPELQFRYYYYDRLNEGYEYGLDSNGIPIANADDADTDRDHVYQVTLKWRLDELIMSSERIRVISESQDVVKLRDKVLRQITQTYFDRRRLQVDLLLSPPADLRAQVEDEIRLMELTAELDALTGGGFSRALN